MDAQPRFVAYEAKEARAESPVPLLIGLTGPSGSGKTYSALRLATGIREIVGGKIFVVDTESRRALHYAEKFDFEWVNFEAPFGSLDYLEALRFCKGQGAGVVIIDSCSHEHDGPGGLLEQHEAELDRMAGNDFKKREAMQMLAWQKPKAGRRKLIAALTTELAMPVIFCFRAKQTTKPMKVDGKMKPVDQGFSSIGANEWLFEMALNAVLLPGSKGVPIWESEMLGEKLAIKLPDVFSPIAERGGPLNEATGRFLAKWAAARKVGESPPKHEGRQFDSRPANPPVPDLDDDDGFNDNPNAAHGARFDDTPEGGQETDETIAQVEGADTPADPAYLAKVSTFRANIAGAKTLKALEQLDREWCNALRGEVEAADVGLMQSVERDIGNRRRELRDQKDA